MNVTHIVVVDDLRTPQPDVFTHPGDTPVHVATTTDAAIVLLTQLANDGDTIHTLYLDHDLGETDAYNQLTIMPLVDHLVEHALDGAPLPVSQIVVHTSNPVGRDSIVAALTIERLNNVYHVNVADAHSVGLAYTPTQ